MLKNFCMNKKFLIVLMLHIFLQTNTFGYELNTDFFSKFNDDYLKKYVYEALENNHDLKQANYRLEQFRYEVRTKLAQEFPNLLMGSSYLGVHFPKSDTSNFFLMKQNAYILPFQVKYEPDFLLKNRDKTKSQKKLYCAQLANQKATYISLITDVASTYLNILLSDYLIKKQAEIIKAKNKNLISTERKYKNGACNTTELNDYRKKYINQKLIYENLVKNQKTMLLNFASLIGRSPECVDNIKRGFLEKIEYTGVIPKTINSDTIYNRPDLIEIENKLKSAKIDITIAKKEFFPSFNINGIYSMDTASGGNFFSWNSAFGILIAGLSQDIFKGGLKIANLKIKKAKYGELFEKYKQADLDAIKEVNNALNLIKQDEITENSSLEQIKLQNQIYNASNRKLKQGTISLMEFLNDESALNMLQQLWANSKTARLVDYITLYKALGGQI